MKYTSLSNPLRKYCDLRIIRGLHHHLGICQLEIPLAQGSRDRQRQQAQERLSQVLQLLKKEIYAIYEPLVWLDINGAKEWANVIIRLYLPPVK